MGNVGCLLAAGALVLCGALAARGAADFVSYEEFGAVGDGKVDDQAAIVAAHAAANAKGLPVRATAGRTYLIGGGDKVAVLRTDTDVGPAPFIVDDTAVKRRTEPIFRVEPDRPEFALKGVKTLARGQRQLGQSIPARSLVIAYDSKVRRYIRHGANQNAGTAQQEIFLVERDGTIDPRTPLVWDFAEVTRLLAFPIDERTLTIRGGVFTTRANQMPSKYTYYNRNIKVHRSNVRIEGLWHFVVGEGDHGAPYEGFVTLDRCADVLITNCLFTAHRMYETIGSAGVPVNMGSYDISVGSAANASFVNCRQTTDILDRRYWGLFGSNYSKNILFDGCVFSRFDAHMGVANAVIRNSTLGHMGINAIGFGTFLVENTTVNGWGFFNLRADYGSTWEGDFIVRNCVYVPQGGRKATGMLINGWNNGTHDFGYVCHMPRRIVFDGLRIEDGNHPENYEGPYLFNAFCPEPKKDAPPPAHPIRATEEVVLKNVTTATGRPVLLSRNKTFFKNVKVTREETK